MFVDVAKLVILIGCILSLYALFHTAFLIPSTDMDQKVYDSLTELALAAGISMIGGLIFRADKQESRRAEFTGTLPVQLFCWAAGSMLVLFVVSWYLESHCIFYRDTRF